MEKRISADTSARARGGGCVESILEACTIRLPRCSIVWTARTFEYPNRCATIRTEPPLTLSVGSTPHKRQGPVGGASRPAERQRGIQRTWARTSTMSRPGWRHQQVGEHHDGYLAIDE